MSLADLRRNWNELAKQNAYHAVLTGTGSARDVEGFFKSGVDEIEWILDRVRAAGIAPGAARALDFGCGLGRVTQALARHVDRVDGVDISEAMLQQARSLNPCGDRCQFHLNERDDLALFGDAAFDVVYSNITLQHMEPRYSRRYIEELFRIARPGAAIVFQLPGEPVPIAAARRTISAAILPRGGWRAVIDAPPSIRCAPGAVLSVQATVRNASTEPWPADGNPDGTHSIRLGNHWRSRFGRMLRFNDVRVKLPHDVAPGESAGILLRVEAPRKPGVYRLELDMVQEHVKWFSAAGSRPTRVRVHVDARLQPGEVEGLAPQMEMYGLPRQEVEALIARAGGVVRAVQENDAPGPGWTSYWYICSR